MYRRTIQYVKYHLHCKTGQVKLTVYRMFMPVVARLIPDPLPSGLGKHRHSIEKKRNILENTITFKFTKTKCISVKFGITPYSTTGSYLNPQCQRVCLTRNSQYGNTV